MAASLNKVMLIGRLGKDPEVRYTQSGTPVATMNIATDESYTDREGKKVDQTEWHRVVVWSRQAENCAKYLRKGSLVFIEGNLQTRQWQDQQGQTRYMTEVRAQRVQFLDSKGGGQGGGFGGGPGGGGPGGGGPGGGPDYGDDMGGPAPSEGRGPMDEVPF